VLLRLPAATGVCHQGRSHVRVQTPLHLPLLPLIPLIPPLPAAAVAAAAAATLLACARLVGAPAGHPAPVPVPDALPLPLPLVLPLSPIPTLRDLRAGPPQLCQLVRHCHATHAPSPGVPGVPRSPGAGGGWGRGSGRGASLCLRWRPQRTVELCLGVSPPQALWVPLLLPQVLLLLLLLLLMVLLVVLLLWGSELLPVSPPWVIIDSP